MYVHCCREAKNREYFVRVGGLSVKIAAGILAVMSTIGYVPQLGSIVSSA